MLRGTTDLSDPEADVVARHETGSSPRHAGRRELLGRLALGLLCGGVSALSVPPFGFWFLAVVGCGVLYLLLRDSDARLRFWTGFGFGLAFFGIGFAWVLDLVAGGWIALVVFEAVVTALACVVAVRAPTSGRTVMGPFPFAAALVVTDALRWAWPFGGIPLGSIALGQAASPLGQLSRVGGPLLVEAVVALLGASLADIAVRMVASVRQGNTVAPGAPGGTPGRPASPTGSPRPRPARSTILGFMPPLSIAAGCCALAVVATVAAPDGGAPTGSIRIAEVQGGGVRGLHAIFTDASVVFDKQLVPTMEIPAAPHVDLVLWPEDVIALDGRLSGTPEAADVSAAARRLGSTVVAGVTEWVGTSWFRNEAVAWTPSGTVGGSYEKVHRVPFGEYVPLRSFFAHLGPTNLVPRDAIPGHGTGLLRTPAAPLGVMISFEVFYPARAASAVRAGARLLVVPTNDASYSTGQVPAQEVAADRLRAIEQGRDLVQAAPTGYTDVVDNRGNLLARTSLGARAVVERTVQLRTGGTWYSVVGDWPLIGLGILALCLLWGAPLASRRERT